MNTPSPPEVSGEPDYHAEMRLPEGTTCADCVHIKRCSAFGFSTVAATSCDFWPNRFRRAASIFTQGEQS